MGNCPSALTSFWTRFWSPVTIFLYIEGWKGLCAPSAGFQQHIGPTAGTFVLLKAGSLNITHTACFKEMLSLLLPEGMENMDRA